MLSFHMHSLMTVCTVFLRFINARRRILQPMLDASNPEPTKKAKSKPQNRPLQRFWPESIANIQPQLPSGLQSAVKSEAATSVTDTVQTQPIVIPIVTSEFVDLISYGINLNLLFSNQQVLYVLYIKTQLCVVNVLKELQLLNISNVLCCVVCFHLYVV